MKLSFLTLAIAPMIGGSNLDFPGSPTQFHPEIKPTNRPHHNKERENRLRSVMSKTLIRLPEENERRELQSGPRPVQTYFIPLPEENLIGTFMDVDATAAGDIVTLISIAVARNNTVIWYDHWEDGYEIDVTNPTQNSTLVIGDGNVANGALEGILTDADDLLTAGTSIIFENVVPVNEPVSSIEFDGRDKIQTSFPIAVTRGAYPETPGSVLAGAVEVQDTDNWGTMFEIPVGMATSDPTRAFELAEVYVMAQEDNTNVTYGNGTDSKLLKQGQSANFRVNEGDTISSSKPIQADLLVADDDSQWEFRWYSLLPREDWSSEYYTPVGTASKGSTVVWLYNPNTVPIIIESNIGGPYTVQPKDSIKTDPIPEDTGARYNSESGEAFFGVVQVDADCCNPEAPSGQVYDWGHPLIPSDQLTSQALIGLGYGCTANNCTDDTSKSVVFAMPVEDATVCVDFDNDGYVEPRDVSFSMTALQGQRISDDSALGDKDMSGALIYAIKDGSCVDPGVPVDIAVAWGQDPSKVTENNDQAISLDLGTVVVPFPEIEASKSVVLDESDADGEVNAGDVLVYTILVQNTRKIRISAGAFLVRDLLPAETAYVAGSTTYDFGSGPTPVQDDATGTQFPLDGEGLPLQAILEPGTPHTISFKVVIFPISVLADGTLEIVNVGDIYPNGNPDSPDDTFRTTTPLVFDPSVVINNLAVLGPSGDCNGAMDVVQVPPNSEVTYCFTITNDGDTFLQSFDVTNPILETRGGNFTGTIPVILSPGESFNLTLDNSIELDFFLENIASVNAVPAYASGVPIATLGKVSDDDESTAEIVTEVPTARPSANPSSVPSALPTASPSDLPSTFPSGLPSSIPSVFPSAPPSGSPTEIPSAFPSVLPSLVPSDVPSELPTAFPSDRPTDFPSDLPSALPSEEPSHRPSQDPSAIPSGLPSEYPSSIPSEAPSPSPTTIPSDEPSLTPSELPSYVPSDSPSTMPSPTPSFIPTGPPSVIPTFHPTPSSPAIMIQNSVYGLQNDAQDCPGFEKITGDLGTGITYCFTVTNTGDTFLTNVVLVNPELRTAGGDLFVQGKVPSVLAPGESFTVFMEDILTTDLINNVTVTASPTRNDGTLIKRPDVTDSDTSEVAVITAEPSVTPTHRPTCGYPDVTIENTVYAGHDGGASCPGNETVTGPFGTGVTYCFVIINDGDMPLKDFVVENVVLEGLGGTINGTIPAILRPNESFNLILEDILVEDLINSVTVSAIPFNEDGSSLLARFDEVSDFDNSAVEVLTTEPTKAPTHNPTLSPSALPTPMPSARPTSDPTLGPSPEPTLVPTSEPTSGPTSEPTSGPTHPPTGAPTTKPSRNPSASPTFPPTEGPSSVPTLAPSDRPTESPTGCPTLFATCFDGSSSFSIIKFGADEPTEVDCAWVAAKQMRKEQHCTEGSAAKDICRKTCDSCNFQAGDARSPGESTEGCSKIVIPPEEPTSPTPVPCKDADDDVAVTVFKREIVDTNCAGLKNLNDREIAYNCENTNDLIMTCPNTCGLCDLLDGCEDSSEDGTVVNPFVETSKTCSWVSEKTHRITRNCFTGSEAETSCPLTCDSCEVNPQELQGCSLDVSVSCAVNADGEDCATAAATFKTSTPNMQNCLVPVTYTVNILGSSTITSFAFNLDGTVEDYTDDLPKLSAPTFFTKSLTLDFCMPGNIVLQAEVNGPRSDCEDAAEFTIEIPTDAPTFGPTHSPSIIPSGFPTNQPSDDPSGFPTAGPSFMPTNEPSGAPTNSPTKAPTADPSGQPTEQPSINPTKEPTHIPTKSPTHIPSSDPTTAPTEVPSNKPSSTPSSSPSPKPSFSPSHSPSSSPSSHPSSAPSNAPSSTPTKFDVCELELEVACSIPLAATSKQVSPTEMCKKRPTSMSFKYIGGNCDQNNNNQEGKYQCEDVGDGPPTSGFALVTVADKKGTTVLFQDTVNVGDTFEVTSANGGRFDADSMVVVEVAGAKAQEFIFHTSCSKNLFLNDVFGALQVVGYTNEEQGLVSADMVEQDDPATETCDAVASMEVPKCSRRPHEMSLRYNGGACSETTNSQFGRLACVDKNGVGAPTTGPAQILVTASGGKSSSNTYFSGTVDIGETFDLATGGEDVSSDMNVLVSVGGVIVQEIKFHSSCSKPLSVLDKFGSIQVISFTNDEQGTVTGEIEATFSYTVKNAGADADATNVGLAVERDGSNTTLLVDGGFVDSDDLVVTEVVPIVLDGSGSKFGTTAAAVGATERTGVPCSATSSFDVVTPAMPVTQDTGTECEGRPRGMSFKYIGGDCSQARNRQNGAYKCTTFVFPTNATSAFVVITDKKGGTTYFSDAVELGETFEIETNGDRVDANMDVTISELGSGVIVQNVKFHSSCSKDLFAGDIFGGIQVVSFTNERQGTVVMDTGI